MKNFPKTIFVTIEGHKEEEFLLVNTSINDLDEEQKVGIYELKDIKDLKVKRSLE